MPYALSGILIPLHSLPKWIKRKDSDQPLAPASAIFEIFPSVTLYVNDEY